jgi:hypothetical protein
MKLMISLLALSLGACADDLVPADRACEQQATLFCGAGRPTLDPWPRETCLAGYMADCMPGNQGVAASAIVDCLDAIVHNPVFTCVPAACSATWGNPDRLAHFCHD